MRGRCVLASIFVSTTSHLAIAFQLHASSSNPKADTVCVSVAAFEEPAYVNALIENFLHFSEPTSKLALHLDLSSEYHGKERSWASERVAITSSRVHVQPFRGSILYAHMQNAKTMEVAWPGVCAYWVLQASNMMWVRSGMEQRVREYKFSPVTSHEKPFGCSADEARPNSSISIGFSKQLSSRKHLYGWGQPEGSFFPMSMVNKFINMLESYLKHVQDDGSGIYDAHCYFENVWLQTFALNWGRYPQGKEKRKDLTPLSRNSISYGDKDHDSVPMSELKAVMKGEKKGYEGYFAVKRVNRDLKHPVTRFIVNLGNADNRRLIFNDFVRILFDDLIH